LSDKDRFDELAGYWEKIEKQIFENCKIKPEEIADNIIEKIVNELSIYEIK